MTSKATVQVWLEAALHQLAAESYLQNLPTDDTRDGQIIRRLKYGFNDPEHSFIKHIAELRDSNTPILPGGNRMVERQAETFVASHDLIAHHVDDQTGFSATLTKSKTGNEYTLSFRSLEFRTWAQAGDRERDLFGAAVNGIGSIGYAIAQIASMKRYVDGLGAQLPADAVLNVTGYSLGGHLASAFTLMNAERVNRTTTFNAAGIGNINFQAPTGAALNAASASY